VCLKFLGQALASASSKAQEAFVVIESSSRLTACLTLITVSIVKTVAIGLSSFFLFSLRKFFEVVAFAFFSRKDECLSKSQRTQFSSSDVSTNRIFSETKKLGSFGCRKKLVRFSL